MKHCTTTIHATPIHTTTTIHATTLHATTTIHATTTTTPTTMDTNLAWRLCIHHCWWTLNRWQIREVLWNVGLRGMVDCDKNPHLVRPFDFNFEMFDVVSFELCRMRLMSQHTAS